MTEDTRIEQARACGRTMADTAVELGVKLQRVRAVWDHMDELAGQPDVAVPVATREQLEVGPHGRLLEPHGTHAAYVRHRDRGEDPCAPCTVAERAYSVETKRRRRGVTLASA